ncbi:unnamed protein product [Brachionus calyciflorus]|uniref:Uncharacterized protein n=1 Tax=Brachionus calyciflorus TaxID=104777 RepID=A0A813MIL5_9BILA|nr:unnamed protein product [Brachionus calyciflorus]
MNILSEKIESSKNHAIYMVKNEFEPSNHYYSKALKYPMSKIGSNFFNLDNEQILIRYSRLKPFVDIEYLRKILNYKCKFYTWGGCDLFKVIDKYGNNQMILIESNTCASGIKSTPLINPEDKFGSYRKLVDNFYGIFKKSDSSLGDLAVIYDQNLLEASGYCSCLAEVSNEKVWLIQYLDNSTNVKWLNGVMFLCDENSTWHSIRACIRLITQQPWKKIPLNTKTLIVNPIITCLAGGRNKNIASYAYKLFNNEQIKNSTNLYIKEPYSLINVSKKEIPFIFENDVNLNKKCVIKVPYDNSGQGVYTIINEFELEEFMSVDHNYEKFVVQSLCGDFNWSSGEYFHLGTLPDRKNNEIYAFDVRMLVISNENGFSPVSINFRRARRPLKSDLKNGESSWDILGTNLSSTLSKNVWVVDEDRLLVLNESDFAHLGLGLDDLIESYVQTVMAIVAIDQLCIRLYDDTTGEFNFELFNKLNPDVSLLNEIWVS